MYGIRVKHDSTINLNTENFQKSIQQGIEKKEIEVFSATKTHEFLREQEMFNWITKGAYMADEKWFMELNRLKKHLENR